MHQWETLKGYNWHTFGFVIVYLKGSILDVLLASFRGLAKNNEMKEKLQKLSFLFHLLFIWVETRQNYKETHTKSNIYNKLFKLNISSAYTRIFWFMHKMSFSVCLLTVSCFKKNQKWWVLMCVLYCLLSIVVFFCTLILRVCI